MIFFVEIGILRWDGFVNEYRWRENWNFVKCGDLYEREEVKLILTIYFEDFLEILLIWRLD